MKTCGLCGHVMTLEHCGSAAVNDTPLCHTDDHDCYHRWTVYKERPQVHVRDVVSEPPFPPHLDGVYHGSAPASLRIEARYKGFRFQIERPGQAPVMVDLSPAEVRAVVRRLTGGAP